MADLPRTKKGTIITPKLQHRTALIKRGSGLKDPTIEKFPPHIKKRLYYAINDACRIYGCKAIDLIWRIDRNGIIQIKQRPSVGVIHGV